MASSEVRGLEADIEETRERLYDTIDRIQQKLTVSGIVDEVMGGAGVPVSGNGHDFVLGLMRRHPVPVMIAAAGLGWMVFRMNRRRAARNTIADAEYVDVPVVVPRRASPYDPDHGRPPSPDIRRSLESRA